MSGKAESERTKYRIREAFLDYCIEYDRIPNVKELCSILKIDRGTFYNHYFNINDLAESIMAEVNTRNEKYRAMILGGMFDLPTSTKLLSQHDRKELLFLLNPALSLPFRSDISKVIQHVAAEILHRNSATEEKYISGFVAEGTLDAIYCWLKDQDTDFQSFSAMLYQVIRSLSSI